MVTKTTNPLRFEDLDPLRFEDLSFNLVYRHKNWKNLIHLGKSGNDGGIDIDGEELTDKETRKWLVQCKRYKSIRPSEIEKILRELVQRNPSYKFIHLIVSCSLSRTSFERINKVKNELSLTEVEVWTNSNLEALLYHNYQDLLNVYFGLSIPGSFEERIKAVEKRKQYRDLLKEKLLKPFNPSQPLFGPHKFYDKNSLYVRYMSMRKSNIKIILDGTAILL